ncbi:MAG: GNAT family N-acetyltransferase [Succinivibrio sp.]
MPADDLSLRWARFEDSSAIAMLEYRSCAFEKRQTPVSLGPGEMCALWRARLTQDGNSTILACLKDGGRERIAGFLAFRGEISLGKVHALYVDPAFMRRGIGRFLLDTAGHVVRMQGGSELEVHVEMLNHGAQAFYRTLHFCASGVRSGHLIIMTKEV